MLLMLLCGSMAASDGKSQLDSLRELIVKPKLETYCEQISRLANLVDGAKDLETRQNYGLQMLRITRDFQDEIKDLYGYSTDSKITPIYVGTGSSAIYPVVGGFIFPVTTTTWGKLPDWYAELENIKDNSLYIWMFRNEQITCNSNQRIIKRMKKFEAE
jgi:hypothetical protein